MVIAFAITQTIGYGCLYYSFAVLLHPIAADLRVPAATVTGAFTTAVLTWAACAIPVGRRLDRHGGRALMTAGSLGGTALLVAWSQVRTVGQLYLVLAGLGVAMAMSLYDAATAVLVSWFGPDQRPRALLTMIVVAGFASTVFMPLTGWLEHRHGWRTTLLVLAAVYGTTTVPLHSQVVRRPTTAGETRPATAGDIRPAAGEGSAARRDLVRAALRDARFWALAVAFVAHSAAMSTMALHLVGYLISRGHPATFAATTAGLLGVLSVTGRLLLTAAGRRLPLTTVVAAIFALQAAAALSLPLLARTGTGAILAVTTFGLGFGIASLAAPTLLADRYGTTAYATIAGTLATPVTLARATAPLLAAALGTPVTTVVATLCVLAAAGILTRRNA